MPRNPTSCSSPPVPYTSSPLSSTLQHEFQAVQQHESSQTAGRSREEYAWQGSTGGGVQDEEEYSGDEENGGLEDDNAREGIDVEPSEPTHPPPAAQHPSTEGAESVMRKLVMDAVAQNKGLFLDKCGEWLSLPA